MASSPQFCWFESLNSTSVCSVQAFRSTDLSTVTTVMTWLAVVCFLLCYSHLNEGDVVNLVIGSSITRNLRFNQSKVCERILTNSESFVLMDGFSLNKMTADAAFTNEGASTQ